MPSSTSLTKPLASRPTRASVARPCPTAPPTSSSKSPTGTRITPRNSIIDSVVAAGLSRHLFIAIFVPSVLNLFSGVDMPPTFGWDNFEDIAIGLADKFSDFDPLPVRFTDLPKWIPGLPRFFTDPLACTEAKHKTIQMVLSVQ